MPYVSDTDALIFLIVDVMLILFLGATIQVLDFQIKILSNWIFRTMVYLISLQWLILFIRVLCGVRGDYGEHKPRV